MIPLLGTILPTINNVLDRVLPDKAEAEKAKAALLAMQVKGDLDQMAGQLQINMKEAENPSMFVAGWRPAVGWVCACGLALNLFLLAIVPLVTAFTDLPADKIEEAKSGLNVAMAGLTPLLMTMLGARTFEKVKGVHRQNMEKKS